MEILNYVYAISFGLIGLAAGTFAGAMPGLNAALGVALLLPFTFAMDPVSALIFLGAIFTGGLFGGALPAILLNIPGSPSNIATCLDGHPMARKGKSQEAIYLATFATAIGGVIGVTALMLLAPLLAKWALKFGPAETFWIYVLGLTIVASISKGAITKGLIACMIGILLSTVGLSPTTGEARFTFGLTQLSSGVNLLAALIGFFGFTEALFLLSARQDRPNIEYSKRRGVLKQVLSEIFRKFLPLTSLSALLGVMVGMLPGAGANIASLLAYSNARSFSRQREEFGEGTPAGVLAPESANGSCIGGDLIPTLTLGIPGSPTSAVIIGGLIIHGLVPGPALFTEYAHVTYPFIYGLFLAQLAIIPVGLLAASYVSLIVSLKPAYLGTAIVALCVVGAYSASGHYLGIMTMMFCGALGLLLRRFGVPLAPVVLGLVLGPGIEKNLGTAVQVGAATGSVFTYLFYNTVSALVLAAIFITVLFDLFARTKTNA